MKTLLFLALSATALAQGPLTPPAAPAPSMKSLDQIEPRIPISTATDITTAGSYYLTSDVAGQINFITSDVTLDLNGFAVRVTADTDGIGVYGTSFKNITIRNGSVVGLGTMAFTSAVAGTYSGSTRNGIISYLHFPGQTSGQNLRIENVTVRGFFRGINLEGSGASDGGRQLVSGCIIRDFGSFGILASQGILRDTVVHYGAGIGVWGNAIVAENLIVERIVGVGISGDNDNVEHINLRNCSGNGMDTNYSRVHGGQISSCAIGLYGTDNQIEAISINSCTASGIISPNSSVRDVTASLNAGAGVWADSSTITHCMVRANGADGIRGVNSIISMCKSYGNDTNTSDGYPASGIVWSGGRQVDNVTDLYAPAAPAP